MSTNVKAPPMRICSVAVRATANTASFGPLPSPLKVRSTEPSAFNRVNPLRIWPPTVVKEPAIRILFACSALVLG